MMFCATNKKATAITMCSNFFESFIIKHTKEYTAEDTAIIIIINVIIINKNR